MCDSVLRCPFEIGDERESVRIDVSANDHRVEHLNEIIRSFRDQFSYLEHLFVLRRRFARQECIEHRERRPSNEEMNGVELNLLAHNHSERTRNLETEFASSRHVRHMPKLPIRQNRTSSE